MIAAFAADCRQPRAGECMNVLGQAIAVALLLASAGLVGCNTSTDTTWRPDEPSIASPGKF
jgi:hypothetical protein